MEKEYVMTYMCNYLQQDLSNMSKFHMPGPGRVTTNIIDVEDEEVINDEEQFKVNNSRDSELFPFDTFCNLHFSRSSTQFCRFPRREVCREVKVELVPSPHIQHVPVHSLDILGTCQYLLGIWTGAFKIFSVKKVLCLILRENKQKLLSYHS